MYESNGEKYFVVDGHMHYWNAAPDNWVPGAEQYAEGWIKCFHAYQGLGPPETHWSLEHFEKYSEDDLMKDVFEDGHVDVAIFQPTYLKEWYKEGFNTTERNALMGEKHPGKFVYNTRFDPRDGDPGLEQLKRNVERFGSKGCKLYTAEWNNGSRGYKLSDPARVPLPGSRAGPRHQERPRAQGPDDLAAGQGRLRRRRHRPLPRPTSPTSTSSSSTWACRGSTTSAIWPPRSRTCTPGLAVAIGALMHARPKFFARVMGELLFWVGEDKMLFGSDYAHLGAEVAGRGLRRLGDAG